MNGTRPNRRKLQYRGGQVGRNLSEAEDKELNSADYSLSANGYYPDQARVLPFKETGVPYTKNYIANKEKFDALRKARFEFTANVWPRAKDGTPLRWVNVQLEDRPSGEAKDALEAKKMNIWYPHQNYVGGLYCSAPFSKGQKRFRFESATSDPNKTLAVSRTLAVGEVCFKIMQYLSYHDIGALQGTCTLVANLIMGTPALWDVSNGRCNYSEFTEDEFNLLKESGDAGKDDEQGNHPFVMISPKHMGYNKVKFLQTFPYNVALVRGVLCVGRSLQLRGDSIKRVCFNRVDFFDVGVFATYLDMMPNLKRADITSCDLIRYHDVPALLDIVQAHNKRHGGKLLIDVAPRYHIGALWENRPDDGEMWDTTGRDNRQGIYGLTYNAPGVKIPTAVVKQYIYDIAPRLTRYGQMHMMEHNALFRRFLEKLPLHSKTVPRMEAIAEHKDHLKRLFAKGNISAAQKAKRLIRCDFAELVTVFGKEGWIQLYEDGARSTSEQGTAANYGVWGDKAECNNCRTKLPLMYMTTGYVCDGCQMDVAVNNQDYHYRDLKMEGAEYLGCGHPRQPMVPLEKTNIDFSILRNEDGTPRISRYEHFDQILSYEVPSLKKLFNHARKMDLEGKVGVSLRDMMRQQRHPCDMNVSIRDSQRDVLRFAYYRKALTLEEIQKVPKGRVYTSVGQF